MLGRPIVHLLLVSWCQNRQPPTLSRQDGCVCSDTLPVLVHPKTTHALYEQPSVVCLRTDDAHLVDQDEPGFERLSSTSSTIILALTRRGSVHRIVPSGVDLWRQLCPAKDAPLDDDDDESPPSEGLFMSTCTVY